MYEHVVIGSGYGGATVAARLAPLGRTLIIERGRRWQPGEFPHGIGDLARAYMSGRNPRGLWAMRMGRGTGNAFASAYGGSSVVNYGISIAPPRAAFDGWPLEAGELDAAFDRARSVLRPEPNPIGDELGDKQFLDMVEPGRRCDIENTIDWDGCTQCGRCVPGCNVGAKRSLDKSYLAMAHAAGAETMLETTVRGLAQTPSGGWSLRVSPTDGGAEERVAARRVVIAAGTLGTLDLLHGARSDLPLGPLFGREMSMNGDGLAFLYDTRHRLSSHSGAPISTYVRLPFKDARGDERNLMVMSGRVPAAAMRFTGAALAIAGELLRDRGVARVPRSNNWLRRLRDLLSVGPEGALSRSFMYKLDGQDSATGTARFDAGAGTAIDWPDYADEPVMRFAAARLERWAAHAGGTLIPNVAQLPGMRAFSVHPLGGCRIGRHVGDGVVDRVGRVFRPDGGVYEGLRIADGSIVRGSLGTPPSLTITALGEHIAESIGREVEQDRSRTATLN